MFVASNVTYNAGDMSQCFAENKSAKIGEIGTLHWSVLVPCNIIAGKGDHS